MITQAIIQQVLVIIKLTNQVHRYPNNRTTNRAVVIIITKTNNKAKKI